jgi:uncharacterized LabA/DUF88 family protein
MAGLSQLPKQLICECGIICPNGFGDVLDHCSPIFYQCFHGRPCGDTGICPSCVTLRPLGRKVSVQQLPFNSFSEQGVCPRPRNELHNHLFAASLCRKVKSVFTYEKAPLPAWSAYDFQGLFATALQNIPVSEKTIYFSKINVHPETPKKSRRLVAERRDLKNHLEHQAFRYVHAGHVRGNYVKNDRGKKVLTFKEKGVDVAIAVDLVSQACDAALSTAILCSSDSDLQPAVREIRRRNVECIYLGFEIQPNKGLTYTTNRTIHHERRGRNLRPPRFSSSP